MNAHTLSVGEGVRKLYIERVIYWDLSTASHLFALRFKFLPLRTIFSYFSKQAVAIKIQPNKAHIISTSTIAYLDKRLQKRHNFLRFAKSRSPGDNLATETSWL